MTSNTESMAPPPTNASSKKGSEGGSGSGNVRVSVRFRPLNKLELSEGGGEAVNIDAEK